MSTSQATLGARSGTEQGPLGGSGGGTQGALPYTQAQATRGEETRPWARTGLCGQLHAPHGPQKTRGRGICPLQGPGHAARSGEKEAGRGNAQRGERQSGRTGGSGKAARAWDKGEEPTHKRTLLRGVRTVPPWIPRRSPKGKRQN